MNHTLSSESYSCSRNTPNKGSLWTAETAIDGKINFLNKQRVIVVIILLLVQNHKYN